MQSKLLNGTYYEIVGGMSEDIIVNINDTEMSEKDAINEAVDTERSCFKCVYDNGVLKEIKLLNNSLAYMEGEESLYKHIGEVYYEPLPYEMRFRYQMLSRLKSDCEYFLGNGKRHEKHLWAGTVDKHIAEMKKRWLEFKEDEKPEWLTWEDIENYEREMKKG